MPLSEKVSAFRKKHIRGLQFTVAAAVIVPLFLREQLGLELLDGVPSLFDETAQISGHAGGLAGPKQDQKEETYNHHLFRTYSEHLSLKLPLGAIVLFLHAVRLIM